MPIGLEHWSTRALLQELQMRGQERRLNDRSGALLLGEYTTQVLEGLPLDALEEIRSERGPVMEDPGDVSAWETQVFPLATPVEVRPGVRYVFSAREGVGYVHETKSSSGRTVDRAGVVTEVRLVRNPATGWVHWSHGMDT